MQTWTWDWVIRNFIAELLMPPGIWLLCICSILFFGERLRQKQQKLIVISLFFIWLSATPIFSQSLIAATDFWMRWPQPLNLVNYSDSTLGQADAIIILGGGRRKGAIESPEYHLQDLFRTSLERVRVGAKLAHQTKLPILVSGGAPDKTQDSDLSEAKVMADILEREFNLKPRWLEEKSHTTHENAQQSAELLRPKKIQKIYLVTHFWHMPRAQMIFEKNGFVVIAVPHGYQAVDPKNPLNYFPNSMENTRYIWHEILGMIWYRLSY